MTITKAPTIFIIMGATGDLMKRKIIPALWHLFQNKRLPEDFKIIGFARRPYSDADFRSEVEKMFFLQTHIAKIPEQFEKFLSLFTYQQGTFDEAKAYQTMVEKIEVIEGQWKVCANKLFYLAVPPTAYETISHNIAKVNLHTPCGGPAGWTRIMIEKPFGDNLKTALQLEKTISRYFKEEQIYRLDHYLGKELIQGILHFRFSNNLLEKSWDNRAIEKIELRILETIGVENRGSFYDAVGALRDVGQNHLLEMLALITMDCPTQMNADGLRKERAKLLSKLVPWTKETLRKHTYRAQHTGYQSIEKVRPNSDTETYFRLKTELDHPLWRGVPIIIEAGKRCPEMQKDIVVTFKHPTPCVGCTADSHVKNTVTFSLTPDDQINIRFWTKKPGFEPVIEERAFTFFVREKTSKLEYAEEYAQLIDSCVRGDQTIFVSKDEVIAAWTFTDPIIEAWQKNLVPMVSYEPDSKTLVPTAEKHIPSVDEPAFPKTIGLIGLGKMGANVGRRLVAHGWTVSAYNRTSSVTTELAKEGLTPTFSLAEMTAKLPPRKIIWLMVPAGKPVDDMLFGSDGLAHHLKRGDIIIDGGNSFYKDTILRAKRLAKKGIHLFDVGTSGGPRGALHGACLMIGGNAKVFEELRPLFRDLSNGTAYQFFPGTGAGHFVKMVHNGIEYGMMQAIAEGFALLKKAHFKLDLTEVASIYNNGSVIESRLTKWLEKAFLEHGNDLKAITGSVAQTGEGAWTAATAKALKIAAPIIEGSVKFRKQSEKKPSYTGKVLSALRGQFGGHATR